MLGQLFPLEAEHGRLDRRRIAMKGWIEDDDNRWDERWNARFDQYSVELVRWSEVSGLAVPLFQQLYHVQSVMSADDRAEIERRWGCPVKNGDLGLINDLAQIAFHAGVTTMDEVMRLWRIGPCPF